MIHHPGKTLAELIDDGVSPIIVPCPRPSLLRLYEFPPITAEAVQKRIDELREEALTDDPS